MSAKKSSAYPNKQVLECYEQLVDKFPDIERKGKTMPYTSVNGHMFSFLDKDGQFSLRLPEEVRTGLMEKYDAKLSVQHGRIMKEYVLVPEKLLKDAVGLLGYFKESYEYTRSLKPKPSKKSK